MSIFEDVSLLYKISKYYYIDNLSQQEIYKKTGISRPQISRILQKAKDVGIVEIKVTMPLNKNLNDLATQVKKHLTLQDVVIVPYSHDNNSLYSLSAEYLFNNLTQYQNIGIGWNKTLYNISLNLSYQNTPTQSIFHPLIGNLGVDTPSLQTNSIVDRFSEKFKAQPHFNNYLALINKANINDITALQLSHIKSTWNNLDCAIIGIGGKTEFDNIFVKELPLIKDFNIDLDNIFGGIMGSFFLNDKTIYQFPDNYYMNAIDTQTLQKIKTVICITVGIDKIKALCFSAQQKYFNILITDDLTAKHILEQENI